MLIKLVCFKLHVGGCAWMFVDFGVFCICWLIFIDVGGCSSILVDFCIMCCWICIDVGGFYREVRISLMVLPPAAS